MAAQREPQKILIVSGNEKGLSMISDFLDKNIFYPVSTALSAGEARRQISNNDFDIVFINSPLPDEFGTDLAVEIAENSYCGVVLFVRNDSFENVSYYVETKGVFCISKPLSKQLLSEALHLIVATRYRLASAERKTQNLKERIEETRIVSRAKLILMEKLRMNETDAHRYIEKRAMDMCVKRIVVATNIIKTYEN